MQQGRMLLIPEQQCIWPEVKVLTSFPQRLVGLLTNAGLPRGQALWFPHCNAIHSWGMRFALDVVGLDAQLRLVAVHRNIQPGRILTLRAASSLIECEAGLPFPIEHWLGRQLCFEEKEEAYEFAN